MLSEFSITIDEDIVTALRDITHWGDCFVCDMVRCGEVEEDDEDIARMNANINRLYRIIEKAQRGE